MILYLMVSLLVPSCLAVEPGPNRNPRRTISSDSLMVRWLNLHRQIYDETLSTNIDVDTLKTLLHEMSSIEKSQVFRYGLKSYEFNLIQNKYEHLMEDSYATNLVKDKDASLTDLLLQTFDYDSNYCTRKYFERLSELRATFKQSLIEIALSANAKLQFQNCWPRWMKQLDAGNKVLGSRTENSLNRLVTMLHSSSSDFIELASESDWQRYHLESAQIALQISQLFEENPKAESEPYSLRFCEDQFEQLIDYPCSTLLNETKQFVMEILDILKFIEYHSDFITHENALVFNKYLFCDRIIADKDFILMEIKNSKMRDGIQEDYLTLSAHSNKRYKINTRNDILAATERVLPNTKIELGLNLADYEYRPDLITQEPLSGEHTNFHPHNNSGPQYKSYFEHTSDMNLETGEVFADDRDLGRAREDDGQSDGSNQPGKNKSHSLADWPREFKSVLEMQMAASRYGLTKHIASKLPDISEQQLNAELSHLDPTRVQQVQPNEMHAHLITSLLDPNWSSLLKRQRPTVVKIEQSRGKGRSSIYRTVWSDGRTTMEKKQFLKDNWRPYLDQLYNVRNSEYQAKFRAKSSRKKARKKGILTEVSAIQSMSTSTQQPSEEPTRWLSAEFPTILQSFDPVESSKIKEASVTRTSNTGDDRASRHPDENQKQPSDTSDSTEPVTRKNQSTFQDVKET